MADMYEQEISNIEKLLERKTLIKEFSQADQRLKKELLANLQEVVKSIKSDIASIELKHGVDGKDGLNGKDGIDGKNGADGKDGLNGKDGLPGKDGKNGRDGKNGLNGRDGLDGFNGLNGKDGVGIDSVEMKDGDLIIKMSNGIKKNLGRVKGNDGQNGLSGYNGYPGKSVEIYYSHEEPTESDGNDGALWVLY